MPFPFVPSTTSHLTFQSNFTSTTHPSLPSAATSQRNILRSALKLHKRLSVSDQSNNLNNLVSCLTEYIKFLLSVDLALCGRTIAGEEVDIVLTKEVEVDWRPTLASSNVPGRDAERVKGKGLDYEICYVHQTFAVVQGLITRQSLLGLYSTTTPTSEQRLAYIQNATKCLKFIYSIHTYLIQRATTADGPPTFPSTSVDVFPSVQSALQRLTHAEFNLLCVLKDDPYPALLAQSRNKDDREWMIKAPEIPKVRAQVLTRLCIGASEHASAALAALKADSKKISKDLLDYINDMRRTSRARACRFQALDNDLAGQTGTGIAWLHAGLNELGIEIAKESGKASGFSKLKSSWNERKEDRRLGKGSSRWGSDGGKAEETRILEFLERKFSKTNNTVNIQVVPEWRSLLAMLPSGMNMPIDERWKPALLTEDELASMRAPPDVDDIGGGDSSGEDEDGTREPVGAFPGTQDEYGKTSYY
jgi:hypothetical protein